MTVATPYELIYERFLSKIHDYEVLEIIEEDLDFAKETMRDYLTSATTHFTYTELNFEEIMDNVNEGFTVELNSKEQEILARFMLVEYMSPKIIKSEIFEQKLGSKDFRQFSSAELLYQLRSLRAQEEERTNTLMLQYYFLDGV